MSDEVSVKFTGSIEGIQTSVTQIREFLQGLEAPIRGVRAQLGELAEAFIAAFAIDKMLEFARSMGEVGEQTERAAAILGASTEDVGRLGLLAKASGTSLEALQGAFGRLSRNITEQSDQTKRALVALGLSFDDLAHKSAPDQLATLATRFSAVEDGADKAAIATTLLGRAGEAMIPFLNRGAEGVAEFNMWSDRLGTTLSAETTGALASVSKEFTLLDAAIQGARTTGFVPMIGTMNSLLAVVRETIAEWTASAKEGGAFATLLNGVFKVLVTTLIAIKGGVEAIWEVFKAGWLIQVDAVKTFATSFALSFGAVQSAVGGFATAFATVMKQALTDIMNDVRMLGGAFDDLLHGRFTEALEKAKKAVTGVSPELKAAVDDLRKGISPDFGPADAAWSGFGERTKKTMHDMHDALFGIAKTSSFQLFDVWNQGNSKLEKENARHNAAMASPTDRDAVKTAEREIDGQIQVLRRGLTERQAMLEAEADLYGLTQDRKFALLQAETEKEYQAELKLLQQKRAIRGLEPSEVQKIDNDIANLRATHRTTMLNLDVQSIRSMAQQYENVLGTITGAFNSQLRGLLAGTTRFKDAFKSMLGDIMVSFIQAVEQMAVKWAAKEIAQTTASVMGASARASASAAADAAGWTSTITNALRSIGASLGMTFAGVSANQAPLLGPAAPAEAAAVTAAVDAAAMGFLSLDVGAWRLPSDGLAMFHRDEMVVPATFAEGLRNNGGLGGGGGDTHNHFNFPGVMDTRGFLAAIKAHDSPIAKMLSKAMTNNRSARPAF
jgi:hypothetical protein